MGVQAPLVQDVRHPTPRQGRHDDAPPLRPVAAHQTGHRSAAAATRNAALAARPKSGLALAQRAIQLARAFHRNDGKAAADLRRRGPEIRDVISTQGGGITVHDADRLQQLVSDAIRAGPILTDDADAQPSKPTKRTPHRRAQIAAWLRLWVPHMRRRWLAGVTPPQDADAHPADAAEDPADALATPWRSAVQPAATNRRLGRSTRAHLHLRRPG